MRSKGRSFDVDEWWRKMIRRDGANVGPIHVHIGRHPEPTHDAPERSLLTYRPWARDNEIAWTNSFSSPAKARAVLSRMGYEQVMAVEE